jgi:hypothetical protein
MSTSPKTGEFTPTSKNKMANQYVFLLHMVSSVNPVGVCTKCGGVPDCVTAPFMSVRSENFSHANDQYGPRGRLTRIKSIIVSNTSLSN